MTISSVVYKDDKKKTLRVAKEDWPLLNMWTKLPFPLVLEFSEEALKLLSCFLPPSLAIVDGPPRRNGRFCCKRDVSETIGAEEPHDNIAESELSQSIFDIDPFEFEHLCADLLRTQGFSGIEVTKRSKDGGVDIHATFPDPLGRQTCCLVQCKRYGEQNKVGAPVVRELVGALEAERCYRGFIITTSSFTDDARREAEAHGDRVGLIDGSELSELLKSDVATYSGKRRQPAFSTPFEAARNVFADVSTVCATIQRALALPTFPQGRSSRRSGSIADDHFLNAVQQFRDEIETSDLDWMDRDSVAMFQKHLRDNVELAVDNYAWRCGFAVPSKCMSDRNKGIQVMRQLLQQMYDTIAQRSEALKYEDPAGRFNQMKRIASVDERLFSDYHNAWQQVMEGAYSRE